VFKISVEENNTRQNQKKIELEVSKRVVTREKLIYFQAPPAAPSPRCLKTFSFPNLSNFHNILDFNLFQSVSLLWLKVLHLFNL